MAFTGKATYSAGTTLPELAEDVSDLIGIISPYETPLLNALGDPMRETTSTHHEWLEDELLPNKDAINDSTYT
ncbi:MAG: SU10 major capsid protein, partial [Planctomycetota bacterium]